MTILFFVTGAVLLHLAVFVSYPKTGPMGTLFVLISVIAWGACFVFLSAMMSSARRSTVLFMNTAAMLLSLLSAMFFMPQKDGIAVFDKLSLGDYPTRASVYEGLKRVGIDYPALKPPEKPAELIEL